MKDGWQFTVGPKTGVCFDVTEGVQTLYDLLCSSMDLGSGFLSREDIEPVYRLAAKAGFDTKALDEYFVGQAVIQRLELWDAENPKPPVHDGDSYRMTDAYSKWCRERAAARTRFTAEQAAAYKADLE